MTEGYGLWALVIFSTLVFAFSFFHPANTRFRRALGAFWAFLAALFTENGEREVAARFGADRYAYSAVTPPETDRALRDPPGRDVQRPVWYPPQMTTGSSTSFRALLAGAAALALVLSSCGSGTSSNGASAGTNHASDFVLNEWAITAPTGELHAGMVRVTVANIGSETHELVIIKASDAASLPTKADGSVDEEAITGPDKPGEIPDVAAGKTMTKTIDLPAGTYVAMCNLVERSNNGHGMSGSAGSGSDHMGGSAAMMDHVHFRLGMHTTFTVT